MKKYFSSQSRRSMKRYGISSIVVFRSMRQFPRHFRYFGEIDFLQGILSARRGEAFSIGSEAFSLGRNYGFQCKL